MISVEWEEEVEAKESDLPSSCLKFVYQVKKSKAKEKDNYSSCPASSIPLSYMNRFQANNSNSPKPHQLTLPK